jgi:hypothetical protein
MLPQSPRSVNQKEVKTYISVTYLILKSISGGLSKAKRVYFSTVTNSFHYHFYRLAQSNADGTETYSGMTILNMASLYGCIIKQYFMVISGQIQRRPKTRHE